MRSLFTPLILSFAALALSACDSLTSSSAVGSLSGGDKIEPLPGEVQALPDEPISVSAGTAAIPALRTRNNWTQTGGSASNLTSHTPFRSNATLAWTYEASSRMRRGRLASTEPLIVGSRAYVLSWDLNVSALDISTGRRLWTRALRPAEEHDGAFGGGMAAGANSLFVSTGAGELHALDLETGTVRWTKPLTGPTRSGPLVHLGKLFVTTMSGDIDAFTYGGSKLWTHEAEESYTGILGPTKAAGASNGLFTLEPGGELKALLIDGTEAWSVDLAVQGSTGGLNDRISDSRALPVVSGNFILASSWSDRTLGIVASTGTTLWEAPIGSVSTPALSAQNVFLVAKDGSLRALRRDSGAQVWRTELTRKENNRRVPGVGYFGPLLAGGHLVVGSSEGYIFYFNISNGALVREINVGSPLVTDMALARGILLVTTADGKIRAYR